MESYFISELRWNSEGKANSPPFWFFVSFAALMGKHGFAEKLHF